jgi:uncharacterized membrane protein
VTIAVTLGGLVDAAFNQVRQTGTGDAAVIATRATGLGQLGAAARTPARRESLGRRLTMVSRAFSPSATGSGDRADFERAYAVAVARLAGD